MHAIKNSFYEKKIFFLTGFSIFCGLGENAGRVSVDFSTKKN